MVWRLLSTTGSRRVVKTKALIWIRSRAKYPLNKSLMLKQEAVGFCPTASYDLTSVMDRPKLQPCHPPEGYRNDVRERFSTTDTCPDRTLAPVASAGECWGESRTRLSRDTCT